MTRQSLECHVSPPEWCHVACQPSPEPPPVNGGQRRQSTVANDGQRRRTTGQRWLTASQPVGHDRNRTHDLLDGDLTLLHSEFGWSFLACKQCGRSAKESDDDGSSYGKAATKFKKTEKTYACKFHKGIAVVKMLTEDPGMIETFKKDFYVETPYKDKSDGSSRLQHQNKNKRKRLLGSNYHEDESASKKGKNATVEVKIEKEDA
ncbi:hypothetical protein Tco_0417371 [Tanacetum coccineum]